jgi:hypothetical protein
MDEKERKRLERKQRILKSGTDRLNKIVNSYSGSEEQLHKESLVNTTISKSESKESQKTEQENTNLKEGVDNLASIEDTEDTPLLDAMEVERAPARINPEFVDNGLVLPALDDPFDFTQEETVVVQKNDILGWIHAALFTTITAYFFSVWLKEHTHDSFDLESESQNVWYKKTCRQLTHMASTPVQNDLGASSVFDIWGYVMVLFINAACLEHVLYF